MVMKDPVVAADGHTYERKAIEEWIASNKGRSPVTKAKLKDKSLFPNCALRSQIEEWQSSHYTVKSTALAVKHNK